MYPFGIDSIPLQLWILQTKATLATQVNTMISAECVVRIIQCSVVYVYKAWILTLSPIMGYSMLPHPFHCYVGGLANYLVGISASVFNLLTNFLRQVPNYCVLIVLRFLGEFVKIDLTEFFLRYLFVIAATWDTKEGAIAKKWLMRPNFHLHLLFMGMIVIFLHGFSTLFQADDQFFFDQGKTINFTKNSVSPKRANINNQNNFSFHFDISVSETP